MVGKDGADAHGASMQCCFPAQAAEGGMPMYNIDLLSDDNVAEDRKEGEDGRQGGGTVDDPEGHVVDLEAVGQVANALAVVVGVSYDDYFVASVNETLR